MNKVKLFAKATFFLKEPKSENETLIYAYFHFNNQQLKLSTGKKIHPKYWDSEKQKVKRGAMNEHDINQRLIFFQNSLNSIYNKLLNDGISPTKELIKSEFLSNDFFVAEKVANFWDVLKLFIEKYTNHGIRPGKRTIQRYQVLQKKLIEYANTMKYEVTFEKVNLEFCNDFVNFLLKKKITNNTVGTYVKNLKLFMRWSEDNEYHNNNNYRKFKVFKTDTYQVSLNDHEIKLIKELDISEKPNLERSRDIFLLQCTLGLRISDLKRLNKSHINLEEGFVEIVSQKTHKFQLIPLSELSKTIIMKYLDSGFPFISEQKLNINIKEICKRAGIDEVVNDYKEIGNELVEEPKPKYSMISTHTARRTFITKMKNLGLPDELIKMSTGHKTNTELNKYYRTSLESAKQVYKELWNNL